MTEFSSSYRIFVHDMFVSTANVLAGDVPYMFQDQRLVDHSSLHLDVLFWCAAPLVIHETLYMCTLSFLANSEHNSMHLSLKPDMTSYRFCI